MTSAIEAIYDNIKAWTPYYDSDQMPDVWDIDELKKESLSSLECPVRMMLAVSDKNASASSFIALGTGTVPSQVTWNILDRLFMMPTSMDNGLGVYNEHVVKYSASYYAQVRRNRAPTSQSHIVSVAISPPYTKFWPEGASAIQYWVVDCVLEVQEFISGV